LLAREELLDVLRVQFGKAQMPQTCYQMVLHELCVAAMSRCANCWANVLEPAREVLGNSLAFVSDGDALLNRPKQFRQLAGHFGPRAPIDRLAPALAVAPAEIHTRHPTAVCALNDAALSPTASACSHFSPLPAFDSYRVWAFRGFPRIHVRFDEAL
jgi:hypothetical protein